MENKTLIEFDIESVKKDFEIFLNQIHNEKILFTGKYGIGKTYFLKNFFEKNDRYECFHLFPINYQINDKCIDIIDLLKYDILIDLIDRDKGIFDTDENKNFFSFIKEHLNIKTVLRKTVSITEDISNIGKILGKSLKTMLEINERFQNYKKGNLTMKEDLEKSLKERNMIEDDVLSEFLASNIKRLKGEKKKSVLILDDLDRIDPENIFRLLNIFSAFFEKNESNKFGFDKIIIVADYSNLKSIFSHKYGGNTDFDGYIDKFYSTEPYYFNNNTAVIQSIDSLISSIKREDKNLSPALEDNGYIKYFIKYFFIQSLNNNLINLRRLLKTTKYQVSILRGGNYYSNIFNKNGGKENLIDISIIFLESIFDNKENLLSKIEMILKNKSRIGLEHRFPFNVYIETLLKILEYKIPTSNSSDDALYIESVYFKKKTYKVVYSNGPFSEIEMDSGNEEDLFLELIIKYINSGNYKKQSLYEYDRA